MIKRSTGRVPIAQPPGSDTRAAPMRATSGAITQKLARILATSSYGAVVSTIVRARKVHGLAGAGLLADALAVDRIVDAMIAKDARKLGDVGEPRQVFQNQRLIGEQGGDHQRQRGVLRSRDRYRAGETPPTDDANTVHCHPSGPIPGRGC